MELLERNRSHGEMGKGMMGDCVGCPDHDKIGKDGGGRCDAW